MTEKIRDFRDLDIWKKGIEIVKDVYRIVEKFPKQEFYGLVSQVQKNRHFCTIKYSRRIQQIS